MSCSSRIRPLVPLYKTTSGLRSRLKSPTTIAEIDSPESLTGTSICLFHDEEDVANARSAHWYLELRSCQ